jgi:hypothetical protein
LVQLSNECSNVGNAFNPMVRARQAQAPIVRLGKGASHLHDGGTFVTSVLTKSDHRIRP